MKKAFYAGSFDPFTNGHLYVVKQASEIFDEVVIAIGHNPKKRRVIASEKMKEAIERTLELEKLENVKVMQYEGLTIEAVMKEKANYLMRGVRNGLDYGFEENLAMVNYELTGVETIYFRAGKTAQVSSSMVLELWQGGREVKDWVSEPVWQLLQQQKVCCNQE